MPLSVEEALKRMEDLAAMVRALADYAAMSSAEITPEALSGMAACAQIQQLAHDTRKSLPVEALDASVIITDDLEVEARP